MTGIGEKAAHVRQASDPGGHGCHWPGCKTAVPPAQWGCAKHWRMLPIGLRNEIWAAYRIGQEDSKTPSKSYVEVARRVQGWIAAQLAAAKLDRQQKELW